MIKGQKDRQGKKAEEQHRYISSLVKYKSLFLFHLFSGGFFVVFFSSFGGSESQIDSL